MEEMVHKSSSTSVQLEQQEGSRILHTKPPFSSTGVPGCFFPLKLNRSQQVWKTKGAISSFQGLVTVNRKQRPAHAALETELGVQARFFSTRAQVLPSSLGFHCAAALG